MGASRRERLARADGDGYDEKRKVIEVGNSKAATLDPEFLESLGVQRGDEIGYEYDESEGQLVMEFPERGL